MAGFASVMRGTTHIVRLPVALPAQDSPSWQSPVRAFAWGLRSVASTVLTLVLFATYLGIGALAHDTHFSLGWVLASTALVWAGPAQIILISTLGSGATVLQAAIAVTVSAIRLFPMVVSVLPMMRTPLDKTASSHSGGPSHRRHPMGRMLSLSSACAARTADRVHPWARRRSGCRLSGGDDDRLRSCGQSFATTRRRDTNVDAAGISVLHRPQLPGTRRRR